MFSKDTLFYRINKHSSWSIASVNLLLPKMSDPSYPSNSGKPDPRQIQEEIEKQELLKQQEQQRIREERQYHDRDEDM
uniref:Membrane associated protein n=1 Tax=Parastrongyloides trichosuri TaxID=131310 RepID=A0A0N4ZBQ3_PARTI